MASIPRYLFFFLLALSFSLHTHARDSKFFNKLTKDEIRVSPVQESILAPSPSSSPEFRVVEHGYGLYGQDPYDNPPTTPQFGEEFSKQSNSEEFEKAYPNYNFNAEKQGMSDTRFLENGKYFYDVSRDDNRGNGYGNQEKQGLSDTRFLENGKYFYDVNNEKGANTFHNTNNNGNENENENENNNFEEEKDTRFLENGKYWYDNNNEKPTFGEFNVKIENEAEKQGMSDTRFLENGRYFYDVNNEKENNNYNYNSNSNNNHEYGDVGFHNKDNIEYANSYNGNGNGNGDGINEKETQGRGSYDNHHNGRGGYNYPNKFPKYEYDSMEEYDREQGYVDGKDEYVP